MRATDPDGPWSRQASQALSTEVGHEPYWVQLTGGFEYDTNVRLSPAGAFPDKSDGRAIWMAEGGLRLFEQLNLQLLIVTPLQKIHIIEPFVNSVGFVHNEDGRLSLLRNLSIEEYREEKARAAR